MTQDRIILDPIKKTASLKKILDEKKEEAKDKKSDDNGAEEEPKSDEKMDVEEEKKQKEWVVNLWIKRKWADELPKVKPIPGFCKSANVEIKILLKIYANFNSIFKLKF